ncbi:MAG: hypothetical protein K6B39_01600 [Lachnospiraceae bacterium]|nr:hypothetical protein [Lachnospiraceae bacterium]
MDVMMLIMLLLVVFVLLELFGIEKSLNRIAKSLGKTENTKNEEVNNDQQVD